MDIRGKNITVVGAARSGLAVARLLARKGASVFLTELGQAGDGVQAQLTAAGVAFEFGGHTDRALAADLVVISPGVPSKAPLVQNALAAGIPVYSEVEAASWFCVPPILAITGTNGKTTTTSLAAHMFETAAFPHLVGGNIGFPFSDHVEDFGKDAVAVLEISSFQLDHAEHFRPKVSVLLNITPDHLDRYDYQFEKYVASKYKIFAQQGEGDFLVYNADDPVLKAAILEKSKDKAFRTCPFTLQHVPEEGIFVQDGWITVRLNGEETRVLEAASVSIPGQHNLYNAMAATLAAHLMGVDWEPIRKALTTFQGVPHRLEFVRELHGVRYVNDSKATNVDAAWYALGSFRQPIVLLAGGRDKGNDYTPLYDLVRKNVRTVIGVGEESGHKVVETLGSVAPHADFAPTMEEAVQKAQQWAQTGDVVLLSPACASFDLFKNYEHRGEVFKTLVQALNGA